MRILMVCMGNICRSPLAEGILRKKLLQRNITAEVDSAGTTGWHAGERPDARAIKIARKYGIDISRLIGRQFKVNDFDQFDKIYAMDSSNFNDLLILARNQDDRNKVDLLMNQVEPEGNFSVPDPYFGGDEGFEDVFNLLDQACETLAESMIEDDKL